MIGFALPKIKNHRELSIKEPAVAVICDVSKNATLLIRLP